VFRWVNGKDPRQYGLDFGLWTRRVVAELIEKKHGVRLNVNGYSGMPRASVPVVEFTGSTTLTDG
jgi:hypothetical protein